jgi:hypothetical protein
LCRTDHSGRPRLFSQIICLVALLLSGCVAPKQFRDFSETARSHPDRASVVDGIPPFSIAKPHADFAPLAAVFQFWKQPVSAGDVEQWYADHSVALSSEDRPVRCAWEHGLWAYGQNSSANTLKARLRAGIPVIVILQANPLDESTRRFAVVIGYDDLEEKVLYHAGERQPLVAAYADSSARGEPRSTGC